MGVPDKMIKGTSLNILVHFRQNFDAISHGENMTFQDVDVFLENLMSAAKDNVSFHRLC